MQIYANEALDMPNFVNYTFHVVPPTLDSSDEQNIDKYRRIWRTVIVRKGTKLQHMSF